MPEDTGRRGLARSTQESLGMEAGGLAGRASPLRLPTASPALPSFRLRARRLNTHTRVSPKATPALAAQERPQGRVTPAAAAPSQPPVEAESAGEHCHSWD